jgi:hypothetical protein
MRSATDSVVDDAFTTPAPSRWTCLYVVSFVAAVRPTVQQPRSKKRANVTDDDDDDECASARPLAGVVMATSCDRA